MSGDIPGDCIAADLGTAPIFDDAAYLAEALCLTDAQSEDELEAQLAITARESGIEDPYRFLHPAVDHVATALSSITFHSAQRSSVSIHSRETQSTGYTSHPSRTSRDHPPFARSSLSYDSYDAVMDHIKPRIKHNHSSSEVSGSRSFQSAASSTLKSLGTPRKKRSSGLFSIFRRDAAASPTSLRPPNPLTERLACGHAFTKYFVRMRIQAALSEKEHVAPSCCGQPIPRAVLELVLTKEEVDLVTGTVRSPVLSQRDSGYSEDGVVSSIDLSQSSFTHSQPSLPFVTAPATPNRSTPDDMLNQALANEAFKSLQAQQREHFQHISTFESNQRKALSAHHDRIVRHLTTQFEAEKAEKAQQHLIELDRLDEHQIIAEHDLRKAHAQEAQNVATALKYMQAYCSGTNPSNSDTRHTVTAEDRKKLARQQLTGEKLPSKHESAINVLRARQEKDTQTKLQKQELELEQRERAFEESKSGEELRYMQDLSRLETLLETRRKRVVNRWDLKIEIWRRDWELQHGRALVGPLPREAWPKMVKDGGGLAKGIDAGSSLAVYTRV
ncbi:hypothetical protein P154DRAFT_519736 [Amniculicola lignicola CBS 123094]|uniref:Uncharacterized protein n=1 Tax=Amniculicola lignicola CBS 123094 TaxID=1392246 RepID=A0A6A5WQL1_9PLEO|nr:hypothetical protein P154DRAFT_519736 [Amniculicola lignicola CBS 123094]